ncbi:hypothetical protein NS365_19355 [Aureimonas ureilytica]|uniref:Hydrolase n=1 Tax=Aureimonas ureilytica TaxID=401562 RepID=A0A175RHL5_9HYPH|nr:hypothetical protein NS365_19355 [Aureimonas ureilytica]
MDSACQPELVIFDCDGVLIDSEAIQCRIDAQELTKLGFPASPHDFARAFVGRTTRDMIEHVERSLGRALPDRFEADRDHLLEQAYRTELRAIEGVVEVLEVVGIPTCVASNAAMGHLRYVLESTRLLPHFEGRLFGVDLVPRPKPAPDLFLLAARTMNVAPARCLVIEDSETGVRAAVAAGMPVFGFHGGGHCYPGYEARLMDAGAMRVFSDMRELPALLRL